MFLVSPSKVFLESKTKIKLKQISWWTAGCFVRFLVPHLFEIPTTNFICWEKYARHFWTNFPRRFLTGKIRSLVLVGKDGARQKYFRPRVLPDRFFRNCQIHPGNKFSYCQIDLSISGFFSYWQFSYSVILKMLDQEKDSVKLEK